MDVVSPSQELIDLTPGRMPIIRATGQDLVYELRIAGGVMIDELFLPAQSLRLFLRCTEEGEVFVYDGHVRPVPR